MSSTATSAFPPTRPLDAAAASLIVLMCMCWGLNQVAIKFTLPDMPPLIQVVIRSFGGMLIVLAWMRWRGIALFERDGTLIPGIIAGVLFAMEFLLIFRGMLYTSASRASLFIYTAPFFVALGARWLLPAERLGPSQWLGLALCFAGIAAAVGVPQANVDSTVLLGDAMLIGAGLSWGATTLIIKTTRLATVTPERTMVYQLAVALPILALASVGFGERLTHPPGPAATSWLVFQVLIVGLTFPMWFTFIQRYSATRVSAFTFLTPLFGVAAGCLLLNEPFTLSFALAVALVVAGLVLVNKTR